MELGRICVFGAGAIGGHLAAKFATAGHDVSVVAHGVSPEDVPRRPGGTQTAGATARKGLYSSS